MCAHFCRWLRDVGNCLARGERVPTAQERVVRCSLTCGIGHRCSSAKESSLLVQDHRRLQRVTPCFLPIFVGIRRLGPCNSCCENACSACESYREFVNSIHGSLAYLRSKGICCGVVGGNASKHKQPRDQSTVQYLYICLRDALYPPCKKLLHGTT